MEQTPRKGGRPKLFLTEEMVEERRVLKRLCKNARRNLQDKDDNLRSSDVEEINYTAQRGDFLPVEDRPATLDEIGGNDPSDEAVGSLDAAGADSPGKQIM